MPDDFQTIYNNLMAIAQKKQRDQVSNTEWNYAIGVIATQLNTMGANLDVVHTQLLAISDLDEESIALIMQRLTDLETAIPEAGVQLIISETEPGDKTSGHFWGRIIPEEEL